MQQAAFSVSSSPSQPVGAAMTTYSPSPNNLTIAEN